MFLAYSSVSSLRLMQAYRSPGISSIQLSNRFSCLPRFHFCFYEIRPSRSKLFLNSLCSWIEYASFGKQWFKYVTCSLCVCFWENTIQTTNYIWSILSTSQSNRHVFSTCWCKVSIIRSWHISSCSNGLVWYYYSTLHVYYNIIRG